MLADAVHFSSFGIDPLSMILVDSSPSSQNSSYLIQQSLRPLLRLLPRTHFGMEVSSLCYAISSLSLCECVFRKIFVFVLHLLLSCAQNGSDRYCCVCSLGASLWRAGRETGCAFLYGVIAIGVVYQEMIFENWWVTAYRVLYTSKRSIFVLPWCSDS